MKKLRFFLWHILFIACCANFMGFIASNTYVVITKSPSVSFDMVGRWVYYIIANHSLFNPPINALQPIQYEKWIGIASNYFISCTFAIFYIITLEWMFKTKPTLWNGIFIGILLSVFPFAVEIPSFGMGVLGCTVPVSHIIGALFGFTHDCTRTIPITIIIRVLFVHSFFGLGLGIGGILFNLFTRRN